MRFDWNSEKNDWLKAHRGVSFEKVIYHLTKGDVWKVANHPNQDQYPGQKIYFVIIDDYIYLVPFVENQEKIFLKTIIPSRKATRDYKSEGGK